MVTESEHCYLCCDIGVLNAVPEIIHGHFEMVLQSWSLNQSIATCVAIIGVSDAVPMVILDNLK